MIINQTILENKMIEGDESMFEYLLDNAENDHQVQVIQALLKLSKTVPANDKRYVSIKKQALQSIGVNIQ